MTSIHLLKSKTNVENIDNSMKLETRNEKISLPVVKRCIPRRTSSRKKRNTKHIHDEKIRTSSSSTLEGCILKKSVLVDRCDSVSSLNDSSFDDSFSFLDDPTLYYLDDEGEEQESFHDEDQQCSIKSCDLLLINSHHSAMTSPAAASSRSVSCPGSRWESLVVFDPPPSSPRRRSFELRPHSYHQRRGESFDLLPIPPRRASTDTLPTIPLRHWEDDIIEND